MPQASAAPSSIRSLVRQHPVVSYFVAAFALAWGYELLLVLPGGMPGSEPALSRLFLFVFLGMALSPPLAAALVTVFLDGLNGLGEWLRPLWRFKAMWVDFVLAICLVPATALLVLGGFCLFSPHYTPAVATGGGIGLVALGIGGGLAAGGLEELGWTGFALRRALPKVPFFRLAIAVGLLHGLWHVVAGYWGDGARYGALYLPYFVLAWMVGLTGLRILIADLYRRTGSLLLAQLAHASYTGGLLILWPSSASALENTTWTGVFAVLLVGLTSSIAVLRKRD